MSALKGSPKTGGRKKGTPNKATADIKALAQKYAPSAMAELGRLATQAESEQARVAAIKELFDRGFGKATQLVGGDPNSDPIRGELTTKIVFVDARHPGS